MTLKALKYSSALFAILKTSTTPETPIAVHTGKTYYALSPQQQGIAFDQLRNPNSTLYNNPVLVHLHERPSPQLLEISFQELVENNDALRIQFAVISGEVRQQVLKNINVPIETYTSAEFCEKALETFVRPFELDRAPLWKIALVDCADGLFLFFDIHHIIICDGLTKSMLFAGWSSIYNKREIVHADLPFAFYAAWTDDVEGRDRVLEKVGAQVNFSIGAKHLMLLRDLAKKFKVILFQLFIRRSLVVDLAPHRKRRLSCGSACVGTEQSRY
ncbi:MAG: hypothetical protein CBCREVIR_3780 [Candidatus Burkholderia crenata]|nr:MAG: hypothetical protein CBCREVIR_3780 [Candidatus Burkholderia crenata]